MTIEYKVDYTEVLEFAAEIDGLDQHAARIIATAMEKSLIVIEGVTIAYAPEGATKHLKGSITHEKSGNPIGRYKGEVFSPLKYAWYVEKGRRPSGTPPPYAPLMLWFMRKHGLPAKEAKSAAFGLARNLTRRPTKAQRPFERAFDKVSPQLDQIWAKVPEDIMRLLQR